MTGKNGNPKTAICLFSGGLDSRLAAKLILKQKVTLTALHFSSVFVAEESKKNVTDLASAASELGMKLECIDISSKLINLVKKPPHGHGSHLNPCIDCRILQLKNARRLMDEIRADFLVTGEVVGQRPMTQQKDMLRHIDKEAGTTELVLRPLSALLLEPTLPEKEGWVDRQLLCDFSGRTRTPQMQLAEELGIENYPPPAGGCRLTEPGYARRLKDLLEHNQLHTHNLPLLLIGRHFRLDADTTLIVGRKHDENETISRLALNSDALIKCAHSPGPTALLRGNQTKNNLITAARITARYGKEREKDKVEMEVLTPGKDTFPLTIKPANRNEFDTMLL